MTDISVTAGPAAPAERLGSGRTARAQIAAHAGSVLILAGACAAARYEVPMMYQMVCGLGECAPGGTVSFDRWTVTSLATYAALLLLPFAVVLLLQLWARGRSRAGRFRIVPAIAVLGLAWTVLVATVVGFLSW